MEYERIHKPLTGTISPTKLRMKLLPPHLHRKCCGSTGAACSEVDTSIRHNKDDQQRGAKSGVKKKTEEDNPDYDSNASSSSFEFQKAERSPKMSIPRSMPSKWNDAEKWILGRQHQQQFQKPPLKNTVRVAPDFSSSEKRPLVVFPLPQSPRCSSISKAAAMAAGLGHRLHLRSKDVHCIGLPTGAEMKTVEMRDMGTEMTPVESKEPSRTGTPAGAMTPLDSPSMPSTPRRSEPEHTSVDQGSEDEMRGGGGGGVEEVGERTRKEIAELGVQLGKMRIAAWASTGAGFRRNSIHQGGEEEEEEEDEEEEEVDGMKEKRASVWEDAERSKHLARYRREETKIHSWETTTKAKLEAEMKGLEAKIEHERAKANAKIMRRIAVVSRKSEERRVAAELKRNKRAEKTSAQAEYIRQTGRIPPSAAGFVCCGWS